MDRILFGDNQFFGVNHMSEEKARHQLVQFKDTAAIIQVLDDAYEMGIRTFMCTTHDRIGEICDHMRAQPARYRLNTPVIFVQNVVADLLLGLKLYPVFGEFARHVRERYGAEPGFITMNLPLLLDALEEVGLENSIVCANINKIGFRMSGGIDAYLQALRGRRCRPIAMSVFASGAIVPAEAIEWVCKLEGLQSIVFGASSAANIQQTKTLIENIWGPCT